MEKIRAKRKGGSIGSFFNDIGSKITNTANDAGNAIKNTATSTANKIANTATSPSTINKLKSAVRPATSVGLETGLNVAGSTVGAPYAGTVLSPAINKAVDAGYDKANIGVGLRHKKYKGDFSPIIGGTPLPIRKRKGTGFGPPQVRSTLVLNKNMTGGKMMKCQGGKVMKHLDGSFLPL